MLTDQNSIHRAMTASRAAQRGPSSPSPSSGKCAGPGIPQRIPVRTGHRSLSDQTKRLHRSKNFGPGFYNEAPGQMGQLRKLFKAGVRMGLSTSCRIVDVICASVEPDGMTVKCHHYWAPPTRPACSRGDES
jgi:hypothetical protein